MHLRIYDPIILAIDLRHRRFGYAVFEGHRQLLDWGTRVYPAVGEAEAGMARKRLATLLRLFSPSAIVLTKERVDRAQISSHIRVLVNVIRREASSQSIPIFLLEESQVRETFHNLGCETKDEIAAVLSRIFPKLTWDLPLERELGQSEHPRMRIFDAVALGLAYWQHSSTRLPPPSD